ncbi:MAG: Holliday junction resolvase RuvX [Ignavibacteriaceae bacterium]|nr:Holliday junction resolvase RuvX [Ignavibacteriaceae bacterium]
MSPETRILAIDYGTKRVGLALSDPMKILASPYETFENNKLLTSKILALIKEKHVEKIVIGYPTNGDGSKTVLSDIIINFAAELSDQSGVACELVDERFSSSVASDRILQAVAKKSKRRDKSLVDKYAAAVILEDYLKTI